MAVLLFLLLRLISVKSLFHAGSGFIANEAQTNTVNNTALMATTSKVKIQKRRSLDFRTRGKSRVTNELMNYLCDPPTKFT